MSDFRKVIELKNIYENLSVHKHNKIYKIWNFKNHENKKKIIANHTLVNYI